MKKIRILLIATLFVATHAHAGMPALPEIPLVLPDPVRESLIVKRQPLALRKLSLIEQGKAINLSCASVVKGSNQHQACLAKETQFNAEVQSLRDEMSQIADEIDAAVEANRIRIIKSMNALAKHLGWDTEEQDRLDKALNALGADGDPATSSQIVQAWDAVLARGQNADIAKIAAQGAGPGLMGAGKQTQYEDCTIFALANAAGLPYSVVAARSTKLIGEGKWRKATERVSPQKTIEEKGLTGGEVVMLAEAFGQVEVVHSSDFTKTLKEGRPVMVNVVPAGGDVNSGHEVVLTKAFQHAGEPWFEMMDSNQGPVRRLYLSKKELDIMLQEKGVAFLPETGTTTILFR